ncbi:MAG: ABC transporter substrate-binding protein [Deltaproteobacteria bacterium]|nr:ABC transporter substrate-binding protein [Candidatus Zymogenaceae bacterium]
MKKLLTLLFAMMLIMALGVGVATAQEKSTLDVVKERGVLIAGVKDSVVPFGFVDEAARDLVGFDVDVCRYIADELGVDLELKPVTSSNRIPMLTDGQVDILAATMTHKMERDEVIDFSITYFMDGQKLLTAADSGITSYEDLAGKKVGSVKGSTSEKNIIGVQPDCEVVSFEGYPESFLALKQGKVVAMTTDSVILVGLKGSDPEPAKWAIVGDAFSIEPYGLGLPENDSEWRDFVNFTLIKMWNTGAWHEIYETWLGPDTNYYMPLTWDMEIWP